MGYETKLRYLPSALIAVGVIFIFSLYPLVLIWPAGWRWVPNQSDYEQMIVGVYATLGVFLILAARDPLKHLSLIWFTVWSSVVHGLIMAVQAVVDERDQGHLLGDVPAMLLVALVLGLLTPRGAEAAGEGKF